MRRWFITRFIYGISLLICRVYCGTWTDAKTEYEKVYTAYAIPNRDDVYITIIPKTDSSQPLDVELEFEMNSLGGYDAVNGAIEVIGSLSMTWTDDISSLASITFDSAKVSEAVVDYRKVWTPVIVLINSANSIQRVGDETYKVRLNLATGEANWKPRMIAKASCTPDVTYFPFDQQVCTLTFAPWALSKSKLRLSVSSSTWKMDNYDKNGVWGIESTESNTYISGDYYYANFTITFNRAPTYFTINLVLPILFLSLLSGFVFLLPAASGERVGFVVTCFLTFVILMQTTMTYLPQSSAPMSLLSYYLILMMMFCAFLTIVTAVLLRVYHKPKGEDVPRWLVHVLEVIKCIKCKRIICKNNQNQTSYKRQMPTRTVFNPRRLALNRTRIMNGDKEKEEPGQMSGIYEERSNLFDEETSSMTESNIVNVEPNGPTRFTNFTTSKRSNAFLTNAAGTSADKFEKINESRTVIAPGLEVVSESSASSQTDEDEESDIGEIDWDSVGKLLDTFFLLVFIGVQCGFSVVFLVPIGTRA